MSESERQYDLVKKHISIYREDNNVIKSIIKNEKGIETFAQALHYLVEEQQKAKDQKEFIDEMKEIKTKLLNMSLEQSTMSEYLSDYLYLEHYNGSAVNINYGTDTDGYRNAKKLAKKRMENNQKGATHRKFHKESIRNETERIEQKRKEMFSKPSSKTSGTGMFKNDFLED